jgi:hypothetical protein
MIKRVSKLVKLAAALVKVTKRAGACWRSAHFRFDSQSRLKFGGNCRNNEFWDFRHDSKLATGDIIMKCLRETYSDSLRQS